jgi:hypothetical protein
MSSATEQRRLAQDALSMMLSMPKITFDNISPPITAQIRVKEV